MKTKISKRFRKIQTLAMILTLSFTGIPVSPVWAGDSTALTGQKQKETVQPVKSVTPVKRVPAALPKASTYTGDLVPPGPLSEVATRGLNTAKQVRSRPNRYYDKKNSVTTSQGKAMASKAPSNTNLKRGAGTITGIPIYTDFIEIRMQAATSHLEFLKEVCTMGKPYTINVGWSARDFLDAAKKVVATVYYNGISIEGIHYAADPIKPFSDPPDSDSTCNTSNDGGCDYPDYTYRYTIDGSLAGSHNTHDGSSFAFFSPHLKPTVINSGSTPPKMNIAFYNTQAAFTKFLEKYYEKQIPLRSPPDQQITSYYYNENLVALVNAKVNGYGEQESVTFTLPATSEAFTYGSDGKLSNYDPNAPSLDFNAGFTPTTLPKFSVPDIVWKEAKKYLAYLEKAYTMSSKSTKIKKFYLDAAGKVAATVYYKGAQIDKIAYANPYYTYVYHTSGSSAGYFVGNDDYVYSLSADDTYYDGNVYAPPMPEPTTSPTTKAALNFQKTTTDYVKFLDNFFTKVTLLRALKNHQMTIYKDGNGNQVAWVDVELDPSSGKQKSATVTTWDPYWDPYKTNSDKSPNQIFTYGLDGKLSGYTSNNLGTSKRPPDPKPQSPSAITVPDSIWNNYSADHYDYLTQAYKKGSVSGNTETFLNGAGKKEVTVYYEGNVSKDKTKIKAIIYTSDSAYGYFYSDGSFPGCEDRNNPGDSGTCYPPPMTPKFDPKTPSKLIAPLFYSTVTAHTKFLDTMVNNNLYQKNIVPSESLIFQTTEYRDKKDNLVATRIERFNTDFTLPTAKLMEVKYAYENGGPDTSQVFTYNPPSAALTGSNYTGPRE